MNRKLLLVTTGLDFGGAEMQLVQLAKKFKERDWKVNVVSMLPPKAFDVELTKSDIAVESLDMKRKIPDPRALFKLVRIINEFNPSVMHGHMVHANILSRLANIFTNVPVVISTAHSIDEGGKFREFLYRITDVFCDLTTQVSEAGVNRYVRVKAVPQGKIKFIPNGIDVKHFKKKKLSANQKLFAVESDEFKWLAVGRLDTPKDYKNMFQALKIADRQRECHLYIVGQGPLEKDLKRYIQHYDLISKVTFLGIRNDIPDLLNQVDGFLMSSEWEGTPMVLLEASACSLPIVATKVGGIPDAVVDEKSGFLVAPKNSNDLGNKMIKMMDLPKLNRKKMGEYGRKHILNNYALESVVDKWEKLYTKIYLTK